MNCFTHVNIIVRLFMLPLAVLLSMPFPAMAEEAESESVSDSIEHGEYLVHRVAQCVQCHTPRDAQGRLVESRLLTGAAIPVNGPDYGKPWATESVSLAGLVNYDESFVRHLLIRGERPDRSRPKSPMPSFELSRQDADAVISYLKSLRK